MSTTLPLDVPAIPSSSAALRDVVVSYRRAQTYLSSSNITSSDAFPDHWAIERDETGWDHEHGDEIHANSEDGNRTPRPTDAPDPLPDELLQHLGATTRPNPNEQTPLLPNRRVSFQSQNLSTPERPLGRNAPGTPRRPSSIDVRRHYGGTSTFGQTLLNSIAILLGTGMLSQPLAFACAGWGAGTLLITFYGFITCYTAKILANIIITDPNLRTYADIGLKAFGRKSVVLTGLLFSLELFAVSVILVTLYADSLHLVLPTLSSDQYKVLGLLFVIPTLFMPLSLLSYTSILGIMSSILIIACIAIDGLSKREAPGSLWSPAGTDWGVREAGRLGISFGLFMAGFSGHVVIPSLARDMVDPSEFDRMITWAFGVVTSIYGLLGAAGYLMFGRVVSAEFTEDIFATPGYNVFLNKLTVWMLVITPLSKFALTTRPLNITVEIWLGIDKPVKPTSPSRPALPVSKTTAALSTSAFTTPRPLILVFERIVLALLAVCASILVPEFSTVMAFLGSFSAFVLCVIGPVCAKVALKGTCAWYDLILLVVAIVMAAWGTVAAFRDK